jgi:DNA uptake protein ComE-like DNA-binding protein
MQLKTNPHLRVLSLLVAASLALAACSPQATPTTAPTAVVQSTTVSSAATGEVATTAKVNLNTATAGELTAAVPNLGSRMLREIMEYRPYASIATFRKEIGKYVDAAQVAAYEQYVFVTIQINDSDAASLQQIPGLDGTAADSLIAQRPFASTDAFLTALTPLVSADALAVAKSYLSAS